MNTPRLLMALLSAPLLAGTGLGAAQAATTGATPAPTPAAAATGKAQPAAAQHPQPAAHRRHAALPPLSPMAMDRAHEHVALLREAEQRRWIDAQARQGRLDRAQAATLRQAAVQLEREQRSLARRGHESVDEALAMSHREDLLDWVIKSGQVQYEPLVLQQQHERA
ncbi:MAG: hypothetical protein JNL85_13075 [Rubrivivax sp.]|nr:hypothetical protein [Rubrivivax sp.]